jgi:hypothetical protein
MAKIDRICDLPEWFTLENYQGAELFGAAEWYEQLTQREYLITLQKIQRDSPELASKAAATFARNVQYVRGASVLRVKIPELFGEAGLYQHLADEKRSVHPLTFRQPREHANNMEWCYGDPDKWFAAMNQACANEIHTASTKDLPLFLTGHLTVSHEQFAAVRVDLNAPDTVIHECFTAWLAEVRTLKGQPRTKKFYRPDFSRWVRYGVLPFLDLRIWAIETKNHIPDRVMSGAISSYDAGESNIRKTVAPLAESLMTEGLSELRALAAIEAIEKLAANPETLRD